MRACSTVGGGVMFIPDEIERKETAQSYTDIVGEEDVARPQKRSLLGALKTLGRKERKKDRKAA